MLSSKHIVSFIVSVFLPKTLRLITTVESQFKGPTLVKISIPVGLFQLYVVPLTTILSSKQIVSLTVSVFKSNNYIKTDIYNRKLLSKNYTDMNKNKLFNYLIQAYETESNIKTIIELKHYLLDKKTKLVLYGYDSFLFDFSKQDGVSTLTEIRDILERNGHMVKSQAGSNYGEMNDISDRL